MLGAYLPYDGGIEFFGRISTVLKASDVVVDLGAGRGAWFYEERSEARRRLRDLRLVVARVIGLDVDPVVLTNPTTTENHLIRDNKFPLADASVDVVVAEYVLEHIIDVSSFVSEIKRVLKPGGHFFARTPHKYHYVCIAARLIKNAHHGAFLSRAQLHRKAEDVFPTAYRLNTMTTIKMHFEGYMDYSYLYASEPTYFFGRKWVYWIFSRFHALVPDLFISNIYVILRKPKESLAVNAIQGGGALTPTELPNGFSEEV